MKNSHGRKSRTSQGTSSRPPLHPGLPLLVKPMVVLILTDAEQTVEEKVALLRTILPKASSNKSLAVLRICGYDIEDAYTALEEELNADIEADFSDIDDEQPKRTNIIHSKSGEVAGDNIHH